MLAINCRSLSNLFKRFIIPTNSKLYATESENNGNNEADETIKPIDFQLTEPLPPIPPNYGWVGDENMKSLFEMNKIRNSFKYG